MMKTVRKAHTGDQDCSCTSCLHKSGSDNQSLRRFIAQGSRIDRLYYGKYIPLRERKLLERLVRTRAVYDDIRAKLISDSTISLSTKGDSKPKKNVSSEELDDIEKGSGAIFELVDLVDKGATLGLSECCSCCSCSSKVQLQDHVRHKHHRPHFGARRQVVEKDRLDTQRKKKGVRFKAKHIRSDPCTCTYKLSGLLKNNAKSFFKKNTPMELSDLQPVSNEGRQPKQKKLREFVRRSYENLKQSNKQLEERVLEGIKRVKDSATTIQEKLQLDVQSSANKLKQTSRLKAKTKTAPPKRLSKTNLQLNDLLAICMCPEDQIFEQSPRESLLDIYTQKSIEKFNQAKNKLKSAMKSTIERKKKTTKIKTKTSGTYVAPEKDLAFQVKKDSIRKFQEELRRKRIMKDWECDPECIEGTCVPEECLIKLQRKHKNMKHRGLEHQIRKQEKKTGDAVAHKNVKIQKKALAVQEKGQIQDYKGGKEVKENIPKKAKQRKKRMPKQKLVTPEKKPSSRQGVRIKSSFSFDVEFFKERPRTEMSKKNFNQPAKSTPSGISYKIPKKPKVYRDQRTSQLVVKHSSRDTQTEVRSLKRCFCTLKLLSRNPKPKRKKKPRVTTAEKSMTTFEPSVAPCKKKDCSVEMCEELVCEKLVLKKSSNAYTNTAKKIRKRREGKSRNMLPYECEPGVCTPGDCDPYECIKLINIREAKVKKRSVPCFCPSRKTKSTSTLTSKSVKASKAKVAQSLYTYGPSQKRKEEKIKIERKNVHNAYGRQAVKIGSTFSFNIEFYKNISPQPYSPPSDLKTFTVKPKVRTISKPKLKERGYQGDVPSVHKNVPTQIYKKEKDAAMSTTLKRCFCTLKLQRKSHSKLKKKKMFSTGTKTIGEPFMTIETSNRGTKTRQKYLKLKPYECEPFTCIPGECNPYECLERINRRNLKDIGVSPTFNRSEINKGSSTSEKSFKAVKTQSKPRSREQKVLTKMKVPKKQPQPVQETLHYIPSAPTKQAVRVGSSFSFNIEFYKNQKPIKNLKPNYEMRPAVKLDTRPITKNKGVKIVKLNVANLDTQVEELKKRNKTSTTKPLLKRCFCTLNLQKQGKVPIKTFQPNVVTVNTALVRQKRLSTHFTKDISSITNANEITNNNKNAQFSDCIIKTFQNECKRLNSVKHLRCQSCNPLITDIDKLGTIKSNFNTALRLISQTYVSNNLKISEMTTQSQVVNGSNTINQYSSQINQERKCVVYSLKNIDQEKSYLTGLKQYLKGYFCTMNLQVSRNKNTTAKQNQGSNRPRKLLPYECEPGVCVPGECDPYECLKMINKRESNFSKRTGTESTVTSTSSYTHGPKYKSYKVQSPTQKTASHRVSGVTQDRHKLGEKQAVRVGSSFSFDIEFSKKSGSPQVVKEKIRTSTVPKPTYPKKSHVSKTTRMNKQGFRNQHSQSAFSKTLQKASATIPRMKRCFCTLKLQKKGRIQKETLKQPSAALQTEPIVPQLTTVDRGQKAPKLKPLKIVQALEPYECQPGICVPGECNPYECLEIMKKLNYNKTSDFGTNAITGESKSSASMTVSDAKQRNRRVYAKPKVKSRTNYSEGRQKKRVQPTKITSPSTRQAVRIGSSFSFDIEFHKSKSSFDSPKEYISVKPSKTFQRVKKDVKKRKIKMKQRTSGTSKAIRDKQSQVKSTVQAASTMTTSFMKRCFCVLNLRKNRKNKIDSANVIQTIDKPVNIDKKTNTKPYKERIMHLEPYECEPGICVPGECDPYVCEKLIKRRNLRTTSSSTSFNASKSTSSSIPKTGRRNINTQFQPKKTTRQTTKQVYTKPKIRGPIQPNRQVVKIGSNFSFDIEFYKDKTPKFKDEYKIPKVKKKEMLRLPPKIKKQDSGTKSQSASFKSQFSQIKVHKRDFAAGFNNIMKRCFCTLQLYNPRARKQNKIKEEEKKPIQNLVHSKSVMTTGKNKVDFDSLQPYECEPNVCVPYECDPYECEKLIKLRQRKQQKEMGISTQYSRNQSAASSTEPFRKLKKRTQSVSFQSEEKSQKMKVKRIKRVQEAQSKQCVKIGSSFSFDIEFFKNKNAGGLEFKQKPQYIQPKLRVQKSDRVTRRIRTKNQGLQSHKLLHARPSQIENAFMKTQSTMARFTPPLKRCFCTFYLKKPKKKPVPIPEQIKPTTSDVYTEANLGGSKVQAVDKLLPYECEPNICIPGECNPIECLERIKKRRIHQKNYGTSTQHLQKHRFSSSMVTTKTRNKRSQYKTSGHVKQNQYKQKQYKQKLYKQPVTSTSNRQAVRIGSNFSFNIDFYKQRGLDNFERSIAEKPEYVSKPLKTTHIYRQPHRSNKKVDKKLEHKIQRNRGNQSPFIKQSSKSSAIEPFLKRCFCTLKLQKRPDTRVSKTTLKREEQNIEKVSKPKIASIDRSTLTKKYKDKVKLSEYECEPFTCIPGECDPYECQKRIQARNLKSRTISTQMLKECEPKCVGVNLAHLNSKKIQSNLSRNLPTKSIHTDSQPSNIVEVPRFGNLFNKQAVKIGSNFSFNIEFYKELLPPTPTYAEPEKIETYEETKPKKIKKHTDAIMTSKKTKYNNKGIQGDGVKTESKALEVGNALKRCFCTLKLQKELNAKHSKPSLQQSQFPQVIEVRRVSVKNKKNKVAKQTFTEVKSVGTKTKAKYLNDNVAECDPTTCRNLKLSPQEMKVIHPYSPNKFNKTQSKTIQNKALFNEKNIKPKKTIISNRGKRLTKKKSDKYLPMNEHLGKDLNPSYHTLSTLKKFMCKCAQVFSHKTQGDNSHDSSNIDRQLKNESSMKKKKINMDGIKTSKSDGRSERDDLKEEESKHRNRKCSETCEHNINQNISSHYPAGDITQNPIMSLKMVKKHHNEKNSDKISHKKQKRQKDNEKNKRIPENLTNETEDFFCSHCKNIKMNKRHSQPLRVHFKDTPTIKKKDVGKKTKAKHDTALLNKSVDQIDRRKKSTMKNDTQSKRNAKYCNYCTSCGEKLNNEEIQNAAGDQKSIKKESKGDEKTPDLHQSTNDKIKNLFKFKQSVDNICSGKGPEPPLFEMHLDSDDYGILNKDEVIDKVTKLSKMKIMDKTRDKPLGKPHGKSCRCCICLAKKNKTGAFYGVTPKGSKGKGSFGKLFPTGKPCVCGSLVCEEKLAAFKEFHSHHQVHKKVCDCGSPVCAKETAKMNKITSDKKKMICICAKERAKQLKILNDKKMKLENEQRAKRLKIHSQIDKIRYKKRRKENKRMEKKIDKSSSDVILMAESLVDIGKFGISACGDLLRLVARTAVDPKHAINKLRAFKDDPSLISKALQSGMTNSGLASTGRRVRLRCLSMRGVKTVRGVLESYPLTNYLLYIASKDPKRRIARRRPRQREQLDFNCSLYMGSLRKKPYLTVYNACPWVYPHFLSLVNLWKQFTDIALFLLAVVVWSPCIFCMEACRAIMCCFFCTG